MCMPLSSFIGEESLFVDAIGRPDGSISLCILFDIVTKQLLHLLFSRKPAMYLNLVNSRSRESHAERVSLRLYSLLVDFASALLRFAQVEHE